MDTLARSNPVLLARHAIFGRGCCSPCSGLRYAGPLLPNLTLTSWCWGVGEGEVRHRVSSSEGRRDAGGSRSERQG